jgi:signal transduction histidine kinase
LGERWRTVFLPLPGELQERRQWILEDGTTLLIEPIRSEDGHSLGFVWTEVEARAFAPDWPSLAQTALVGMALAVAVLVPLGWMVGKRMTRPVERLVAVIERIGQDDPGVLDARLPSTRDPELGRIVDAVRQLMAELERRRLAEERALSAERLAAVGRMTAAIAHEINNPLAGLLTAVHTLRGHGADEAVRSRTLDVIERGLQQVRVTVAALLPQARIEDRPLEPGDLEDVVQLVQVAISGRLRVRIDHQVEVESALRVPSAPLRQVMLNLMLNAIKAAGDNGVVEAVLSADEHWVRFCVRNTGAVLTRAAFEQTLSAESRSDPRGFGLWVCQQLANHLRGRFVLDDGDASRTCLRFEVPNREGETQSP